MSIDNTLLTSHIQQDINFIRTQLSFQTEQSLYPTATHSFFSRFVELEQFIIEAYIKYSLGESSVSGYSPIVNVRFPDEDTLRLFHKPIDKYVTVKSIKEVYKAMFGDGSTTINPFQNFFTIQYNDFEKLECVRNVIAHQSPEAYKKFYNKCTSGATCALEDYLFVYQGPFHNYYEALNTIKKISDLIVTPI